MDRRDFIFLAATTPLILTSGCLAMFSLLRVGARGSLIRSGARAARRGRRGQLATVGRTGAATLHLMRIARVSRTLNKLRNVGEVYGVETDETAIVVQSDAERCETNVEGTPIMKSRVDGRFYSHSSVLFGDSGYSSSDSDSEDENVIRHWNHKNQFVGADVYEKSHIRHIDQDSNLLGTTPIQVNEIGDSAEVIVKDDSYLRSQLTDASNAIREDHAEDLKDIERILRAQDECREAPNEANCSTLAKESENALRRLEARFSA